MLILVFSAIRNKITDFNFVSSLSRSHSPARSRLRSPGRMSAQNGDKDWENGSTISSPASIPEYTGECNAQD